MKENLWDVKLGDDGYPTYMTEGMKKQVMAKERLQEEMKDRFPLVLDDSLESWKHARARTKRTTEQFFMHDHDVITGKPQLLNTTIQDVALYHAVLKKVEGEAQDKIVYKFFNESIDKRHLRGRIKYSLMAPFFLYRVVTNKREFILFSQKELEPQEYRFSGMLVPVDTATEISRSLRFRSLNNIFIVRDAIPNIQILNKKELVDMVKAKGITYEDFRDYIFTHPQGKVLKYPETYESLRIAQLLSGKWEGYPLHTMTFGPAGTGKTMELECLDNRFLEEQSILEAANSRPKSLIPSFKEKPASPGYILSCNRMALIDEMMKMIEEASNGTKQEESVKNMLSQLNMLLEHKKRTIGSGNDNTFQAKATAKVIITTNPFFNRETLEDHIGIIDITTLSRMLIYMQDKSHVQFIDKEKVVTHNDRKKILIISSGVTTNNIDDKTYLTIYDSCNNILVFFDILRVQEVYNLVGSMLGNSRLSRLWNARGLHHTILLLDGLVKARCLFKDYTDDFTAKDEDYAALVKLITGIVKTWLPFGARLVTFSQKETSLISQENNIQGLQKNE